MEDQEWLIGVRTPQELRETQERLQVLHERAVGRHLDLLSWHFEQWAIAQERRWQREHFYS